MKAADLRPRAPQERLRRGFSHASLSFVARRRISTTLIDPAEAGVYG